MKQQQDLTATIRKYLTSHGHTTFHPKAVFYDMDGVLFDSMPFHAEAWTSVLKEQGIPFEAVDAYANEGRTGKDTIDTFFLKYKGREATEEELKTVYQHKAETFASIYKVRRVPHILQLMEYLASVPLKCYLVTGSGQHTLLNTLNEWFPAYFNETNMITAYDVTNGKPSPEPYQKALKLSGLQPNEVFVIENAPLGVRSAVDAGIFTFAVNTGILPDELLTSECGESGVVLSSMEQLHQVLKVLPRAISV